MRDNPAAAGNADVPGRIANSGDHTVSAATAAATAATAASDGVPGWIVGPGRYGLPDPAASASAAAEPRGRTRLS